MAQDVKKQVLAQLEVFRKNSVDLISETELAFKLEESLLKNKPLILKIGFDPTARDIHFGHTVLLKKLRALQNLGHQVHLIIGDFTAKIGDPSGKSILRPILSDEEIQDNASTYTNQAFKILDKDKTKIFYNSSWFKDKKLSEFLSLLSSYTIARILERDDFSQRLKENKPLTMLEVIYPLIQGYDSVMLKADVEFGGTDQKFNLIVGRHLQEACGQKPQCIITMPLLVGLDGKNKMSKSLGNYVAVLEEPKSMFGKVMSISDEVMWEYFRLLTDCNINDVKKLHPKEAKLLLAQNLVSFYHNADAGQKEKDEFQRVFSQKEVPSDIPVFKTNKATVNLLEVFSSMNVTASGNESRRLFSQGAVSIFENDPSKVVIIKEPALEVPLTGIVLKIGKKKFLRIELVK